MPIVTLNPTKDRQDNGSGTSTTLRVGTGSSAERSLLFFDLSALRIGSINSATLKLYPNGTSSHTGVNGFTIFKVYRATQDWTEGGAVDISATDDGNAIFAIGIAIDTNTTISVSIKPTVELWLSGQPNYGVKAILVANPDSGWIDYKSREAASARPELVLDYVEKPIGYHMMM